jgi:hypothetical protein
MMRLRRAGNRKLKQARIDTIQQELMETPTKTVGYEDFLRGLQLHNVHTAELQAHYSSRTKLDERLRRYARQQKGVQRLLKCVNIPIGSTRIVAFGRAYTGRRAKFGDSMPVAPVKMVSRQLAKRCRVVLTNEHRSSKTHATCGRELDFAGAAGCERFTVCACGENVERDLNAAMNIAAALLQYSVDGTSPAHLDRDPTRRSL